MKPSWGGIEALCRHVVSYLEPCWAMLSDHGGHLGLSEALLEPSLAILGALTPRDRACPGPGDGGRGRGKPVPEGEERGPEGRGWELNHSRPKGLVGLSACSSCLESQGRLCCVGCLDCLGCIGCLGCVECLGCIGLPRVPGLLGLRRLLGLLELHRLLELQATWCNLCGD